MTDRSSSPDLTVDEALDLAVRVAREILAGEDRLPARLDPDTLRRDLDLALGPRASEPAAVVEGLTRILLATPSSASSRFLNQLFGGRDPMATLAEMLTPLTNTSMYTFKVAGPQVLLEQEVLGRMCELVGFPSGEGMLCPGGSMSNLVAMLLARNEAVPAARDRGLEGRSLVVYASADAHYSIPKNAGILGIGRRNVREVPIDDAGRMDVKALSGLLADDVAAHRVPLMISATAGTTVLGAFDPIEPIADLAAEHGAWLHVDGALGGSASLVPELRRLLSGSARADSFTWNAHKMLGVPLPCSAILVRRRGLLARSLNEPAEYLFQADDESLNPGTRSIQCGRRNDALKLWATWKLQGDDGLADRVRRLFSLAHRAAELVDADPDLELVLWPQSVNVCFVVPGHSTAAICDALDDGARYKISHGMALGRRALRLVCVNPDLTETDLRDFLAAVKEVAAGLPAE